MFGTMFVGYGYAMLSWRLHGDFSSYFVTMWHRNVFADFVVDFFQDFMTMYLRDFFTVRNGDLFRRFYRNFMTHGFSDNMTKWFWVTVMVSVVTFGLRFGLSLCFTFPSGMTSVTVCTIRIMPVRSISIRSGIIGIMGFGTNLFGDLFAFLSI